MTTLSRRLLIVPAALAALALGACSSPYGSSSAAAPPATTTTIEGANTPAQTRGATFRADLTHLLVEHSYLLAASIPPNPSVVPQLAANGADLAALLGQPYGAAFGTQFLQLWTARTADIQEYARAKAAKDTTAATAATTQLASDVTLLANIFHSANKYLAVHTVSNPATGVADELTADDTAFLAWVDAAASADATSVAKLVTAGEAMPHTADVLAAATAKLYPSTYPGTVTGTASNLRASLTTMLVEHLELASNVSALLATGQESGPQDVALNANGIQLHNAFASIYNDDTAATFSTLWGHLVDGLRAYAKAAAAHDAAASDSADAQLHTFAGDFGQFIATTTGKIDAATVTSAVQAQIADVEGVVKAATPDSSGIFVAVRHAVAHGPVLAAIISEAVAEAMPARYLP